MKFQKSLLDKRETQFYVMAPDPSCAHQPLHRTMPLCPKNCHLLKKQSQNVQLWKMMSLTHEFVCSLNSSKIGKPTNTKPNIKIGRRKSKKREGGVFHRQNRSKNFQFYKCYDISFYSLCEKQPLIWKPIYMGYFDASKIRYRVEIPI